MNASPAAVEPGMSASLIAEPDRDHDFGAVLAWPGRKMSYAYHLVNGTGRDVKILNVINHKTCFGTAR